MANREYDKTVGKNLVELRGDRSQQAVADAMRELGHRWTQATVWAIEKGERSLKLEEAVALAEVLDVSVLSISHWGDERAGYFARASRDLFRVYQSIVSLAQEFTHTLVRTSIEAVLLDEQGELPEDPIWWHWTDAPIRQQLVGAVDRGMRDEASRTISEDYSDHPDFEKLVEEQLAEGDSVRLESRRLWEQRRGEHQETP